MIGDDVSHLSASESVFRALAHGIVNGEFPAGSVVSENALAERFGVSRTPLREAIARLEWLGYVKRQVNRSLIVAPFDVDEMENLSWTREGLEGISAHLATLRQGTAKGAIERLKQLNQRIGRLAEIGEIELQLAAGIEFHREVLRIGDNACLARHLEQVLFALEKYRYLVTPDSSRGLEIYHEHESFLAAMANGDAAGAEQAMRTHIANGRCFYRRALVKVTSPTRAEATSSR